MRANSPRESHTPFLRKTTAFFLLICFTYAQFRTGALQAQDSHSLAAYQATPDFLPSLSLPSELGTLQEIHAAKESQASVILIQDAHAIPDAQKSIRRIVEYFQTHHGVGLVALEGAPAQLDPTLLRNFPDREKLEKVFQGYLDAGEISGAAAAAVLSEKEARYYGIEERGIYEEIIAVFLNADDRAPAVSKKLSVLRTTLEESKKQVYSPELLDLDRKIRGYEEDAKNLIELLRRLVSMKSADGFKKYPHLSAIASALNEEENSSGDADLRQEVQTLAKRLRVTLERHDETKAFYSELQGYKTERISPRAFAHYLLTLAEEKGVETSLSARLQNEIEKESRLRGLQGTEVFRELHACLEEIQNNLYRNDDERDLARRDRELHLLEKLVRLKLTREEWNELQAAERYSVPFDDREMAPFTRFYELAVQRDSVFFEKLDERLKKESSQVALVVAGGFHTEGLAERFKKENISYVVFSPRMDTLPSDDRYVEFMRGNVSWKKYFEVEEGHINLYEAFHRATIDKLLENGAGPLLKTWRDRVLRDLSAHKKIETARHYTRFLDEAAVKRMEPAKFESLKKEWLKKVEGFVAGLKELKAGNRLTPENIVKLTTRPAAAQPTAAMGLVPGVPFPVWRRQEIRTMEIVTPELWVTIREKANRVVATIKEVLEKRAYRGKAPYRELVHLRETLTGVLTGEPSGNQERDWERVAHVETDLDAAMALLKSLGRKYLPDFDRSVETVQIEQATPQKIEVPLEPASLPIRKPATLADVQQATQSEESFHSLFHFVIFESGEVQLAAIQGIIRLGAQAIPELLKQLTTHAFIQGRIAAALVLGGFGPAALEALADLESILAFGTGKQFLAAAQWARQRIVNDEATNMPVHLLNESRGEMRSPLPAEGLIETVAQLETEAQKLKADSSIYVELYPTDPMPASLTREEIKKLARIRQVMNSAMAAARKKISRPKDKTFYGVFSPAPIPQVVRTLKYLGFDPSETFFDAGSGRAELLLTILSFFGLKGAGAEANPEFHPLADAAHSALQSQGLLEAGQATLIKGDYLGVPWNGYNNVFYYSFGGAVQGRDDDIIAPMAKKAIEELPPGGRFILLAARDKEYPNENHYQNFGALLESGQFVLQRIPEAGIWVFTKKGGTEKRVELRSKEEEYQQIANIFGFGPNWRDNRKRVGFIEDLVKALDAKKFNQDERLEKIDALYGPIAQRYEERVKEVRRDFETDPGVLLPKINGKFFDEAARAGLTKAKLVELLQHPDTTPQQIVDVLHQKGLMAGTAADFDVRGRRRVFGEFLYDLASALADEFRPLYRPDTTYSGIPAAKLTVRGKDYYLHGIAHGATRPMFQAEAQNLASNLERDARLLYLEGGFKNHFDIQYGNEYGIRFLLEQVIQPARPDLFAFLDDGMRTTMVKSLIFQVALNHFGKDDFDGISNSFFQKDFFELREGEEISTFEGLQQYLRHHLLPPFLRLRMTRWVNNAPPDFRVVLPPSRIAHSYFVTEGLTLYSALIARLLQSSQAREIHWLSGILHQEDLIVFLIHPKLLEDEFKDLILPRLYPGDGVPDKGMPDSLKSKFDPVVKQLLEQVHRKGSWTSDVAPVVGAYVAKINDLQEAAELLDYASRHSYVYRDVNDRLTSWLLAALTIAAQNRHQALLAEAEPTLPQDRHEMRVNYTTVILPSEGTQPLSYETYDVPFSEAARKAPILGIFREWLNDPTIQKELGDAPILEFFGGAAARILLQLYHPNGAKWVLTADLDLLTYRVENGEDVPVWSQELQRRVWLELGGMPIDDGSGLIKTLRIPSSRQIREFKRILKLPTGELELNQTFVKWDPARDVVTIEAPRGVIGHLKEGRTTIGDPSGISGEEEWTKVIQRNIIRLAQIHSEIGLNLDREGFVRLNQMAASLRQEVAPWLKGERAILPWTFERIFDEILKEFFRRVPVTDKEQGVRTLLENPFIQWLIDQFAIRREFAETKIRTAAEEAVRTHQMFTTMGITEKRAGVVGKLSAEGVRNEMRKASVRKPRFQFSLFTLLGIGFPAIAVALTLILYYNEKAEDRIANEQYSAYILANGRSAQLIAIKTINEDEDIRRKAIALGDARFDEHHDQLAIQFLTDLKRPGLDLELLEAVREVEKQSGLSDYARAELLLWLYRALDEIPYGSDENRDRAEAMLLEVMRKPDGIVFQGNQGINPAMPAAQSFGHMISDEDLAALPDGAVVTNSGVSPFVIQAFLTALAERPDFNISKMKLIARTTAENPQPNVRFHGVAILKDILLTLGSGLSEEMQQVALEAIEDVAETPAIGAPALQAQDAAEKALTELDLRGQRSEIRQLVREEGDDFLDAFFRAGQVNLPSEGMPWFSFDEDETHYEFKFSNDGQLTFAIIAKGESMRQWKANPGIQDPVEHAFLLQFNRLFMARFPVSPASVSLVKTEKGLELTAGNRTFVTANGGHFFHILRDMFLIEQASFDTKRKRLIIGGNFWNFDTSDMDVLGQIEGAIAKALPLSIEYSEQDRELVDLLHQYDLQEIEVISPEDKRVKGKQTIVIGIDSEESPTWGIIARVHPFLTALTGLWAWIIGLGYFNLDRQHVPKDPAASKKVLEIMRDNIFWYIQGTIRGFKTSQTPRPVPYLYIDKMSWEMIQGLIDIRDYNLHSNRKVFPGDPSNQGERIKRYDKIVRRLVKNQNLSEEEIRALVAERVRNEVFHLLSEQLLNFYHPNHRGPVKKIAKKLLPNSHVVFRYTSDYGDVQEFRLFFQALAETDVKTEHKRDHKVVFVSLDPEREFKGEKIHGDLHRLLKGETITDKAGAAVSLGVDVNYIDLHDNQNPQNAIIPDAISLDLNKITVVNLPGLPRWLFDLLMVYSNFAIGAGDFGTALLIALAMETVGPAALLNPHAEAMPNMREEFDNIPVEELNSEQKEALEGIRLYFKLLTRGSELKPSDREKLFKFIKDILARRNPEAYRYVWSRLAQRGNMFTFLKRSLERIEKDPKLSLGFLKDTENWPTVSGLDPGLPVRFLRLLIMILLPPAWVGKGDVARTDQLVQQFLDSWTLIGDKNRVTLGATLQKLNSVADIAKHRFLFPTENGQFVLFKKREKIVGRRAETRKRIVDDSVGYVQSLKQRIRPSGKRKFVRQRAPHKQQGMHERDQQFLGARPGISKDAKPKRAEIRGEMRENQKILDLLQRLKKVNHYIASHDVSTQDGAGYVDLRRTQYVPAVQRALEILGWNLLSEYPGHWELLTAIAETLGNPNLVHEYSYATLLFIDRMNKEEGAWEKIASNPKVVALLTRELNRFDRYMNRKNTWLSRNFPHMVNKVVAYFTAEIGSHLLNIYGGGLGVLSGDHIRGLSDLGYKRAVAVSLLYRLGYFRQSIVTGGRQIEDVEFKGIEKDEQGRPIGIPVEEVLWPGTDKPMVLDVPLPGRGAPVKIKIWRARYGHVDIFLPDTDIPGNSDADRKITGEKLYRDENGRTPRVEQYHVLGVGGMMALQALGFQPDALHLNDSHPFLAAIQAVRQEMENLKQDEPDRRLRFEMAMERVHQEAVFTTHTPIPAGNEKIEEGVLRPFLNQIFQPDPAESATDPNAAKDYEYMQDRILSLGMVDGQFTVTAFSLRMSSHANGVSALHGGVSRKMWKFLYPGVALAKMAIIGIVNSVHSGYRMLTGGYWQTSAITRLFRKVFQNPEIKRLMTQRDSSEFESKMKDDAWVDAAIDVKDEELWAVHVNQKKALILELERRYLAKLKKSEDQLTPDEKKELEYIRSFNPEALTIGFARRFIDYKRANLIFRDLERLLAIAETAPMPIQIVYGGKAHPKDEKSKAIIEELHRYIQKIREKSNGKIKIVFLEEYNIASARVLEAGVDVWLNNPVRPQEASGTSGMKVALNGGLNLSTKDGWSVEGVMEGVNGWLFGVEGDTRDDLADSEALYSALENKLIPLYYEPGRKKWIRMMKAAVVSSTYKFGMERMLAEYTEKMYEPAVSAHEANTVESLRQIAKGKISKREEILGVFRSSKPIIKVEKNYPNYVSLDTEMSIHIVVDLKGLTPEDIGADLFIESNDSVREPVWIGMNEEVEEIGGGKYRFTARVRFPIKGKYDFSVRLAPKDQTLWPSVREMAEVSIYEPGLHPIQVEDADILRFRSSPNAPAAGQLFSIRIPKQIPVERVYWTSANTGWEKSPQIGKMERLPGRDDLWAVIVDKDTAKSVSGDYHFGFFVHLKDGRVIWMTGEEDYAQVQVGHHRRAKVTIHPNSPLFNKEFSARRLSELNKPPHLTDPKAGLLEILLHEIQSEGKIDAENGKPKRDAVVTATLPITALTDFKNFDFYVHTGFQNRGHWMEIQNIPLDITHVNGDKVVLRAVFTVSNPNGHPAEYKIIAAPHGTSIIDIPVAEWWSKVLWSGPENHRLREVEESAEHFTLVYTDPEHAKTPMIPVKIYSDPEHGDEEISRQEMRSEMRNLDHDLEKSLLLYRTYHPLPTGQVFFIRPPADLSVKEMFWASEGTQWDKAPIKMDYLGGGLWAIVVNSITAPPGPGYHFGFVARLEDGQTKWLTAEDFYDQVIIEGFHRRAVLDIDANSPFFNRDLANQRLNELETRREMRSEVRVIPQIKNMTVFFSPLDLGAVLTGNRHKQITSRNGLRNATEVMHVLADYGVTNFLVQGIFEPDDLSVELHQLPTRDHRFPTVIRNGVEAVIVTTYHTNRKEITLADGTTILLRDTHGNMYSLGEEGMLRLNKQLSDGNVTQDLRHLLQSAHKRQLTIELEINTWLSPGAFLREATDMSRPNYKWAFHRDLGEDVNRHYRSLKYDQTKQREFVEEELKRDGNSFILILGVGTGNERLVRVRHLPGSGIPNVDQVLLNPYEPAAQRYFFNSIRSIIDLAVPEHEEDDEKNPGQKKTVPGQKLVFRVDLPSRLLKGYIQDNVINQGWHYTVGPEGQEEPWQKIIREAKAYAKRRGVRLEFDLEGYNEGNVDRTIFYDLGADRVYNGENNGIFKTVRRIFEHDAPAWELRDAIKNSINASLFSNHRPTEYPFGNWDDHTRMKAPAAVAAISLTLAHLGAHVLLGFNHWLGHFGNVIPPPNHPFVETPEELDVRTNFYSLLSALEHAPLTESLGQFANAVSTKEQREIRYPDNSKDDRFLTMAWKTEAGDWKFLVADMKPHQTAADQEFTDVRLASAKKIFLNIQSTKDRTAEENEKLLKLIENRAGRLEALVTEILRNPQHLRQTKEGIRIKSQIVEEMLESYDELARLVTAFESSQNLTDSQLNRLAIIGVRLISIQNWSLKLEAKFHFTLALLLDFHEVLDKLLTDQLYIMEYERFVRQKEGLALILNHLNNRKPKLTPGSDEAATLRDMNTRQASMTNLVSYGDQVLKRGEIRVIQDRLLGALAAGRFLQDWEARRVVSNFEPVVNGLVERARENEFVYRYILAGHLQIGGDGAAADDYAQLERKLEKFVLENAGPAAEAIRRHLASDETHFFHFNQIVRFSPNPSVQAWWLQFAQTTQKLSQEFPGRVSTDVRFLVTGQESEISKEFIGKVQAAGIGEAILLNSAAGRRINTFLSMRPNAQVYGLPEEWRRQVRRKEQHRLVDLGDLTWEQAFPVSTIIGFNAAAIDELTAQLLSGLAPPGSIAFNGLIPVIQAAARALVEASLSRLFASAA